MIMILIRLLSGLFIPQSAAAACITVTGEDARRQHANILGGFAYVAISCVGIISVGFACPILTNAPSIGIRCDCRKLIAKQFLASDAAFLVMLDEASHP